MSRVRGGGATLVGVRVVSFGLTGLAFVAFARFLQPHQYGEYAAAQSVVTVLLVLQLMGFDQLYLQAEIDDQELEIGATQVTLIDVTLVLVAAALWPGLNIDERLCVLLLGAASCLDLLKTPWLLKPARELDFAGRAVREALSRTSRVLILILIAALVREAVPLAAIGLALAVLLLLPTDGRLILSQSIVSKHARSRLRQGVPFAISSLLFTVYFAVDASLLASLRPPAEVAYYRAAYNLVQAAIVLPVALNMDIMRPRLYSLARQAQSRRSQLKRFGLITVVLGLVIGIALAALSHPIVELLYGSQYVSAAGLLSLLALALPFHYLTSWLTNGLIAFDAIRPVLVVQLVLATLNVTGNLILIPREGAHGAAVMTLATEFAGSVLTGVVAIWLKSHLDSTNRRGDLGS